MKTKQKIVNLEVNGVHVPISMRLGEAGEGFFLPEDALDLADNLENDDDPEHKVAISLTAHLITDGMSKQEAFQIVLDNLLSPSEFYSNPVGILNDPQFIVKFINPEDQTPEIRSKLISIKKFNQIANRASEEDMVPGTEL